jgi:hypothetical protein
MKARVMPADDNSMILGYAIAGMNLDAYNISSYRFYQKRLGNFSSAKNEFERKKYAEEGKTVFENAAKELLRFSKERLFIVETNCFLDQYSFQNKAFNISFISPDINNYYYRVSATPNLFPNLLPVAEDEAERIVQHTNLPADKWVREHKRGLRVLYLVKADKTTEGSYAADPFKKYPIPLCRKVYAIFVVPGINEVIGITSERDGLVFEERERLTNLSKELDGDYFMLEWRGLGKFLDEEIKPESFSYKEKNFDNKYLKMLADADSMRDAGVSGMAQNIREKINLFKNKCLGYMKLAADAGKELESSDIIVSRKITVDGYNPVSGEVSLTYSAGNSLGGAQKKFKFTGTLEERPAHYTIRAFCNEIEGDFVFWYDRFGKLNMAGVSSIFEGKCFFLETDNLIYPAEWVYKEIIFNGKSVESEKWIGKTMKEELIRQGKDEAASCKGIDPRDSKSGIKRLLEKTNTRLIYQSADKNGSIIEFRLEKVNP